MGKKPLRGSMRTNDKLVTRVKLSLGFGLEPHWWKLSASPLLLLYILISRPDLSGDSIEAQIV